MIDLNSVIGTFETGDRGPDDVRLSRGRPEVIGSTTKMTRSLTLNRHSIGHLSGKGSEVSRSVCLDFHVLDHASLDLVSTAWSGSKPRSWPVRVISQARIQRAPPCRKLIL